MKFLLIIVYVTVVLSFDHWEYPIDPGEHQASAGEGLLFQDTNYSLVIPSHSFNGNEQVNLFKEIPIPRERRRGKSLCKRRLGGKCVRRRKRCPGHLPSQTSPGRPYCSKFHRCCHQAECPDGFFKAPGTRSQCLKVINGTSVTYEVAKTMCKDEGLVLPKPEEPVALRKLLVETYGLVFGGAGPTFYVWLGAEGVGPADSTGSVVWNLDGTALPNDDPAWWPSMPGIRASTGNCLILAADIDAMAMNPTKPYVMEPDFKPFWGALCELVQ